MKKGVKKALQWSVTAIILIVSIYYATKGIDYTTLWQVLKTADYEWVLIPIPIMLLSHWLRAMRWRTMLKPIFEPGSLWNMFSAVMIGYAMNNVIPRGGEFLRPYVYAKREKKSFSSVFATIVVERFIDVLTLFALFGIAFIIHRQKIVSVLPSNIQPDKLIFLVALMMAVVIFSFYPPFVEFMLSKLIKPFSTKLYDRARDIFVKFRKGFAIIKNPSQYLRLMLESISIWICYALPMYFIFFAFNFQSEIQLGIADALLLMVVIGVGVTIAPTPGAIGIYHGLVVAAMTSLYGISQEKALAYATVTHGINFLVQIVFGGLFFLRENISKIPTNTSEIPSELEEETQVKPN